MASQNRTTLIIDANTTGAESGVRRLATEMSGAKRLATDLSGAFGALSGALGGLGLVSLVHDILKVNIEMEQLRVRLDAVYNSAVMGAKAFDNILQIAKETPQSVGEISKAYIMLKNFGIEPTMQTMRDLTNATSKLGGESDTLTGIARALGQAWGKGKLQAEESNQMIERGVPVYALLAQVTGKTTAEILKMQEAGQITRPVMEALRTEMGKWGEGASAKMMDTLGGKLSMLADEAKRFKDNLLGSNSEGAIGQAVSGYTLLIGSIADALKGKSIEQQIDKLSERINNVRVFKENYPKAFSISDEKELNALIEQRNSLFLKQAKTLNEAANNEKLIATQKKAEQEATEMANARALANGDSEALKKYMTAKLDAVGEINKKIIATEAEIAGLPVKLATTIVAIESTGKVDALNKNSGAAGLMQVMPENYKKQGYTQQQILSDAAIGVRAGLKVYQDSLNEAKKAVIKGTIEEGQLLDYANALYTTKHKTIAERIKKNNGIFDMQLMPTATIDWNNKFKAGFGLQNINEGEASKFITEQAKVAKKTFDEQEKAAKKLADEKQRIYENTAIGKYLTDMEQLNRLYGDDRTSVTYQENAQKIADTFLKSTVDLNAYNESIKQHKKLLDGVGDYNATIDELTRNKQRGAITQGEYGLGIAQANAGLMNQVTDKQVPVERVGEVIDAKNFNESEKALTKFNEETKKTIDSFHQLDSSGKMAFDGILGGISAVASAATSFSDVMTKLNDNHVEYAKSYEVFMRDSTKTEADKAIATKRFAEEKAAYESASFKAEISGMRSIAGATANMFGEKSSARKAFHAIEMTLGVVEMRVDARNA